MKNEKKLLQLARDQFAEAQEAESVPRQEFQEDLDIFDGHGVWPERLRMARENDPKGSRPCLTISDMAPRVHQVTNDFRMNRPAIKIRPVDDKADEDTAKVFNGLARHVEQQSDADIAYETANFYQTVGGYGFFRMTEEVYEGANELMIKAVQNPNSVYMDPFALDPVGCDARYCFVIDQIPRKVFERDYPRVNLEGWEDGDDQQEWLTDDSVRIAEWFHIEEKSANKIETDEGEVSEDAYWATAAETGEKPEVKNTRIETRKVCMWRKMVAGKVLKEIELPISYIPVFRMAGESYIVNGRRVFKGLVRDSRDSVRMVSYWFSAYTESVALQPKAPFIGVAGQFDGFESDWGGANTDNNAYLEYNAVDINGAPAPPPQRSQPPLGSQGIMQGLQIAREALKDTTGLGAASLGQKGNETSGKAILARQREGDTSTYHLQDNAAKAIRQCGRVFVQWAPKVYNEATTMRIIGEDGQVENIAMDPTQQEAVRKVTSMVNGMQGVKSIYNLGVGRYDVVAGVGPSYTTKRVEQAEMMNQLFQSFPASFQVLGDIFMENQDGPGTDRMAKRLKAMLPPQVAQAEDEDQGPNPQQMAAQLQQFQGQLQEGKQIVTELMQENEQLKAQLQSKDAETRAKMADTRAGVVKTMIQADAQMGVAAMNNETKAAIAGLTQLAAQLSAQQERQQYVIDKLFAMSQAQSADVQAQHQRDMDMRNADSADQQQQFSQQMAMQPPAQPTPPEPGV